MANNTATISAMIAKPVLSTPWPSIETALTVKTVMIALPIPEQVLPMTDSFSLSFGWVVTAGIILQNGISIMV